MTSSHTWTRESCHSNNSTQISNNPFCCWLLFWFGNEEKTTVGKTFFVTLLTRPKPSIGRSSCMTFQRHSWSHLDLNVALPTVVSSKCLPRSEIEQLSGPIWGFLVDSWPQASRCWRDLAPWALYPFARWPSCGDAQRANRTANAFFGLNLTFALVAHEESGWKATRRLWTIARFRWDFRNA